MADLTMTEAARRLRVTRVTVRRLVREGILPTMENPLDKRQRLIPEAAIQELEARPRRGSRHFRSDGAGANADVRSDQIKEYLRAHWRLQ